MVLGPLSHAGWLPCMLLGSCSVFSIANVYVFLYGCTILTRFGGGGGGVGIYIYIYSVVGCHGHINIFGCHGHLTYIHIYYIILYIYINI